MRFLSMFVVCLALLTVPPPGNSFEIEQDLIALHYDHAPDRDDGHAAASALAVVDVLNLQVTVVGGAYGMWNADRYVPESEAVMDAVWGSGWSDAHNYYELALQNSLSRWLETLDAGGEIWVAEGGQADFTADLLREIRSLRADVDTRSKIHIVQHSDWNEVHANQSDLNYVRNHTDYILIEDGNFLNSTADLNQKSEEFVDRALSSRYSSAWVSAFDYLSPDEKLDFSDTVELLYIVGIDISQIDSPDSFADLFFQASDDDLSEPSSPIYWSDSYSVDGQCYCDTTFDHNLGGVTVGTPVGLRSVAQICSDISKVFGQGRSYGRKYYNTVQCGHDPANSASDEQSCPGFLTDGLGRPNTAGCDARGARWNLALLYRDEANNVADPVNPPVHPSGHPYCQSPLSDSDGDGYGWENNASCVVGVGSNGGQQLPTPQPVSAANDCTAYSQASWYRQRGGQTVLSPSDDWQAVINASASDTEILLQDGVYSLSGQQILVKDNITIRSVSGDHDTVLLQGQGSGSSGLVLDGDNITLADFSVAGVGENAISIRHSSGSVDAPHLYNLHVYDVGARHLQLEPGGSYDGLIACSMIGNALDSAVNNNNGAVDLQQAFNWHIRDNLIYNINVNQFECQPDSSCEGNAGSAAIQVSDSAGTITEHNRLVNSAKNIAYGLGHYGGAIRNNVVQQWVAGESGIDLLDAHGVVVEGNNIILAGDYPGAVQYRESTGISIRDNRLSSHPRDRGDNIDVVISDNASQVSNHNLCDVNSARLRHSVAPNQWNLLALPCHAPEGSTLNSVFGDDIDGVYRQDWIAYKHNTDAGYKAVDADDPADMPGAGDGFWLIQTTQSSVILDLPEKSYRQERTVELPCLSQSTGCVISNINAIGASNWSISGNPLDSAVDMSGVSLLDTSECSRQEQCGLLDASDRSLLHDTFYSFSAEEGYELLNRSTISPWTGFWLAILGDARQPRLYWPVADGF